MGRKSFFSVGTFPSCKHARKDRNRQSTPPIPRTLFKLGLCSSALLLRLIDALVVGGGDADSTPTSLYKPESNRWVPKFPPSSRNPPFKTSGTVRCRGKEEVVELRHFFSPSLYRNPSASLWALFFFLLNKDLGYFLGRNAENTLDTALIFYSFFSMYGFNPYEEKMDRNK
ncbi:hypothetical protein ACLOJK_001534 [Asimina triloba]